jgi:hypothetical protein
MEKISYAWPAIKIIIAAIITIIGIFVKLMSQEKMLKTKKISYINRTPIQEIGIRIIFLFAGFYTLIMGILGLASFGDWYFFVFFLIGIIYFFVSIRDYKIIKNLKK